MSIGQGSVQKTFLYTYLFTSLALAPGATATITKNILSGFDFNWIKGMYFADIAAAAQTESARIIPLVTVLLTDTKTAFNLMDSAVPMTSLFGTGELPFILPKPYRFESSGTITMTLANFSSATTYNLRLAMNGISSQA